MKVRGGVLKKYTVILASLVIFAVLTACSSANDVNQLQTEVSEQAETQIEQPLAKETITAGGRTLVAYFSNTGNTEGIANIIADYTGGELFEIRAAVPYTADDLNYSDSDSRTSKEQNDDTAKPEIENSLENAGVYDVIFLGYPIWWGQAPKILYTFIETNDFSAATIVPFCTSGSSGIGSSGANLQTAASADIRWLAGQRFGSGAAEHEVQAWIDGLGLDSK